MDLIDFPERTVIVAKNQPEYRPMPAHYDPETGVMTCCWSLSWRERLQLIFTGKMWHQIVSFGRALQPQLLQVEKPALKPLPPL